ncbi:MAG TPA: Crp/Fnr family transcriptional regulator [Mucilaginibacter sp.]|nr:Crp/Fnr family transcriptional regulator [Mucilaginibacter sp.]
MKRSRSECDLKSCLLCRSCLKEWIPAIAAQKTNIFIRKGQSVFTEGEKVRGIFFIYSGLVKVHKKWDDEKELIIRFARQGEIIGHMGLGDEGTYPVTATALEPAVVCYIDSEFFETTLKVNNDLTYKLLRLFANELQESEKRMRNLVHMPVKTRIAQAFLSLAGQFGIDNDGWIGVEITRQDISSFAGTSYETLFKVINDFTEDGLIGVSGKKIRIINEAALREITTRTD